MAFAVILLVAGSVVLAVGAETTLRGVARLPRWRGFHWVFGATLLFGLCLEALGPVLVAAGRGQGEIAAGIASGTLGSSSPPRSEPP